MCLTIKLIIGLQQEESKANSASGSKLTHISGLIGVTPPNRMARVTRGLPVQRACKSGLPDMSPQTCTQKGEIEL
jgi:hypothetical protein